MCAAAARRRTMAEEAARAAAAAWQHGAVADALRASEAALCAGCGGSAPSFDDLLALLRNARGAPCVTVWTAGALAYRCRTCQARARAPPSRTPPQTAAAQTAAAR